MINLELRKYIECTPEEKKPLQGKIAEIVNLANITRAQGVLALEQQIEKTDDRLLQIGITLIVDGTDPEVVKNIIDTIIINTNKTGTELLSQLMVREGLLAIQAGYNPSIIKAKLLAYLGDVDAMAYSLIPGLGQNT